VLAKIVPPVLAALVIVGCGGQLRPTPATDAGPTPVATGKATSATVQHVVRSTTGRPQGKPVPVERYLAKRMLKPEEDNEGPDKPARGRAPLWSYHVVLARAVAHAPRGAALTAQVTLRGSRVCWQFTHVDPVTAASAVATTIHVGAHGRTGPELVVFGTRFSPRGCIVVRSAVVNSIAAAPHLYYLRVAYRGAAARGQL
jgi:hypothetical protein